jgi:hypothetical protein
MSNSSSAGAPEWLSHLVGLVVGSMKDILHLGPLPVRVVS